MLQQVGSYSSRLSHSLNAETNCRVVVGRASRAFASAPSSMWKSERHRSGHGDWSLAGRRNFARRDEFSSYGTARHVQRALACRGEMVVHARVRAGQYVKFWPPGGPPVKLSNLCHNLTHVSNFRPGRAPPMSKFRTRRGPLCVKFSKKRSSLVSKSAG